MNGYRNEDDDTGGQAGIEAGRRRATEPATAEQTPEGQSSDLFALSLSRGGL